MTGFGCYESGPIGTGSVNGGTTCSKILAVGKANAKVKAMGVMLADLATESEILKLSSMIEDGELTEGQLRVLGIAYGQVEVARVEAGEQERVGKELVKDRVAAHGRKSKSGPCDSKVKRFTAFGDVTIGFGRQGAAIITSVKEPKVGHVKWGKVKDSVGGRGAAIVTDAQQRPLKCFCFHDTPRRPCQDGVPSGHVSGQAGLCAYKH